MTNAERQNKDIMAQMCETGDWAVNKNTGEVIDCNGCNCETKCLFYKMGENCDKKKVKWLNAEYQEPKREFSEEDKAVVRALDKVEWWARDEDGVVYGYLIKPKKGIITWHAISICICISNAFTSAQFLPISWDDKEPTNRKEILGEEK